MSAQAYLPELGRWVGVLVVRVRESGLVRVVVLSGEALLDVPVWRLR